MVAVAAGAVLGAVDLVGQLSLPYPWANLANSPAVWAAAAFAVGVWVRQGQARPALAGVLLLLIAVEGYYLAATLVLDDALANLWSPATVVWLVAGVLAGLVFGPAGALWRSTRRWPATIGLALLGAVFVAEGIGRFRTFGWPTALILVAIGLAVTATLGRSTRHRLLGLALLLPFAALGAAAYLVVGAGSI